MSYPPGGYGGPGGYPNQGYPPPGYGGYGGQVEHPQGTTVLILGICGLVLCQILAPFAWSMGNKALEEIDRDPLRYSNRSNVNTGRILGIVGSVLLGIYVLLFGAYLVILVAVLGTSSST
ncbi:DUF4190 domain-containing protein [Iamia sp. SCSIO 61187]|uniref:DUF4190 domain-containing protein n=1 Tax=Iamia sp. SCSIO 61187 TaxID=2722752 RepID=UPI001C637E32|nr:DUF4190 domain-containing protein [Iamia sp. SCSIO 61187]QYG94165.1 DUF4190 domain-containing protein [Iamia sp. SCSIO 61187]